MSSFNDLIQEPKILKVLEEIGFQTPTPIQQQAIPQVLNGRDLRASAQTGTGKTAAFLLPALCRLATPVKGVGPRILVLVPTRELAMQVATEAAKYSRHLSQVRTVCIYGGVPYARQNKDLARPHEILVGTPGRIIDMMERGRIQLSRVEMFILDEADRMLDMGFLEPVEEIARGISKPHQTLMFSATLKGPVLKLSNRLLNDPAEVFVEHSQTHSDNIEQRLHGVDNITHKYSVLDHLLSDPEIKQAIVFTSTKYQANQLVDKLDQHAKKAAALHGDMNQRQRTRTIAMLREGKIDVLVATDVAARGIDVLTVTHVINFDLPRNPEDYVHRIGRTGRAGAKGVAASFVSPNDRPLVKRIEKFTGQKMLFSTIPGLEPKKVERSEEGGRRRDEGGRDKPRFGKHKFKKFSKRPGSDKGQRKRQPARSY